MKIESLPHGVDAIDSRSIGQHLQNWLIKNHIDVTAPLFPGAVDLAIENALRQDRANGTSKEERQ